MRLLLENGEGYTLHRHGGYQQPCRTKLITINGVVVDYFREGLGTCGMHREFDREVEERMKLYEKALGVERVDAIMEILTGPDEVKDPYRPVDEWTDDELRELVAGKTKPYMIPHNGDAICYYLATDEERAAWNAYTAEAVLKFDSDPSLDSYDSHAVYPGHTRDGIVSNWVPPKWFPEWLAERRGEEPKIIQKTRKKS